MYFTDERPYESSFEDVRFFTNNINRNKKNTVILI